MEPKYLTLIQAVAIVLVLAFVVVKHDPAGTDNAAGSELAAQH